MKSTFKVLFYLKRDKQKANGNVPLFCRVTVDGQESRFGMKTDVAPAFWDVQMGRATGRTKDVVEINALMDSTKASLHRVYHELLRRDNNVSSEKVKNEFLGISDNHETLLSLFHKHNDDVFSLIGVSKSKATYQKYEVTRKHLETFIRTKYHLSDISLKEINNMFLNDFEVYLLTTGGCNPNTTAKFMQFFKRIIIIAKNNGYLFAECDGIKLVLNGSVEAFADAVSLRTFSLYFCVIYVLYCQI